MAVNRARRLVPEQQCYVDFERKLSDVLKEVKQLIKEYGPDAYIDGRTEDYSDSDKETFYVYTMVPENDKKYNERIAYEEKWAKEAEERDAREFARLQAKFGAAK